METFAEPKKLVENPHFPEQRRKILAALSDDMIDAPIVALIGQLNRRPFCFTLQCCCGHFLYSGQKDALNLAALPRTGPLENVEYRLAYIAFCVENSPAGSSFLDTVKQVVLIDPDYIQFCSAEWFWNRQPNSYALQVEPARFKHLDTALLAYEEALHVEKVRGRFFERLGELLDMPTRFRVKPSAFGGSPGEA